MHPRHNTYQADQVIDAVHADADSRALQTTSALQRFSRPCKDRHLVPRVHSWGFVAASRRLVPLGPQHRLELSTGVKKGRVHYSVHGARPPLTRDR